MARRGKAWSAAVAFAASALLCPPDALAQTNYDGALIGGYSSLMGGTGVAGGTDGAAPLQNPATTVDIEGTSFVFSTFFIQLSGRKLSLPPTQLETVQTESNDLNDTAIKILPNSTCLFFDIAKPKKGSSLKGKNKFSFCLAEPETNNFEFAGRGLAVSSSTQSAYQQRTISQTWRKQVIAAGWAWAPSESFSIGISPHLELVSYRDLESIITLVADSPDAEDLIGAPADQSTNVLSKKANSTGFSALFGARYQAGSHYNFGLSFQTPSWVFSGKYSATFSNERVGAAGSRYLYDEGSARFRFPARLAAGFGAAFPGVKFEVNGYLHFSHDSFFKGELDRTVIGEDGSSVDEFEQGNVELSEGVGTVANIGFGAEIPIKGDFSLLVGALTDFSGLPKGQDRVISSDNLFRMRTDRFHGSVGMHWHPRVGSILLGVRGYTSSGDLWLAEATSLPVQSQLVGLKDWGVSLVLSGQLSLEMLAVIDPTGVTEKLSQ